MIRQGPGVASAASGYLPQPGLHVFSPIRPRRRKLGQPLVMKRVVVLYDKDRSDCSNDEESGQHGHCATCFESPRRGMRRGHHIVCAEQMLDELIVGRVQEPRRVGRSARESSQIPVAIDTIADTRVAHATKTSVLTITSSPPRPLKNQADALAATQLMLTQCASETP